MILGIFRSTDPMTALLSLLIALPALLFSLSCHEYAHGLAAYKQGDGFAKSMGRLTLNPFKHLDFVGTLCLLLFGYGWAKPVPIVQSNLKNGKKSMLIVSSAGIIANLILAIVSAFLMYFAAYIIAPLLTSSIAAFIVNVLIVALNYMVSVNCVLAVFNIIPVPPLDGYNIVKTIFMNAKNMNFFYTLEKYNTYVYIAFIAVSYSIGFIDTMANVAETGIHELMRLIFTAFI